MSPTSLPSGPAADWTLRFENLEKAYGPQVLFEGLSFEVRPGQAVRVSGANGSGKTQLLLCLGGFVGRFPPVLDACDGARQHGAGDEVEPIVSALMLALEKEGLERVDPAGEPFDPTVAEAVVHEPGDGGEHVVAEVLRAGYTFNGRVLRPAMVKVTD